MRIHSCVPLKYLQLFWHVWWVFMGVSPQRCEKPMLSLTYRFQYIGTASVSDSHGVCTVLHLWCVWFLSWKCSSSYILVSYKPILSPFLPGSHIPTFEGSNTMIAAISLTSTAPPSRLYIRLHLQYILLSSIQTPCLMGCTYIRISSTIISH